MPVPSDPFTFTNGTIADGGQVNSRFSPLYAALNNALDVTNLTTTTENTWLKLAANADRKVAFGSYTDSDWGGGQYVANRTLPHGLGVTPVAAFMVGGTVLNSGNSGGIWPVTVGVQSLNSTNIIYIAAVSAGPSGPGAQVSGTGGATYRWLAIG